MSAYTPFQFEGMDELRQALRDLPNQLKAEVAPIVDKTLRNCAAELKAEYAKGPTGNLRKGVRIERDSPLSGRVRATAPHTHLYEFGTAARQATSKKGANRGRMPKRGPVLVPVAVKHRAAMLRDCEEVLNRPRPAIGDGSMGS